MRFRYAILMLALSSSLLADTSQPSRDFSSLPASAQAKISASVGEDSDQYHVRRIAGGFQAESAGLKSRFTRTGVEVNRGSARWGLALRGYGHGDKLQSVAMVGPQATKNRVEYRRGMLTEWYVNGPLGLEQGFTLAKKPGQANGQPLTIALGISGNLVATVDDDGTGLALTGTDASEALHYKGLTAYDADGKDLYATLRIDREQLLLQVDDTDARYPIVVDPVVQLAKLTASAGQMGDSFGGSVAISGDVVVVGSLANVAYVFSKPPNGWKNMTQTAKLTASDGGGFMGARVAISGSIIVAGAPQANQGKGAVYVFVRPANGWKDMTETALLIASDGVEGDNFGFVAISGETVVVGANHATVGGNQFQGAAYVFTRPMADTGASNRPVLTEVAKLTASDGDQGSFFGGAVSITVDTVAVGAPFGDQAKGEAYVFVRPPSGWKTTTETAKLRASDVGGGMGSAISTNGNVVVAGAPEANGGGTAYVFVKDGDVWTSMNETAELLARKVGWFLGDAVGIDSTGRVIAVGAPQGNGHQNAAGDVFVFVQPPGGWKTTDQYKYRIFASDGQSGDGFGGAISLTGKTLVGGAPGAGGVGAGYLFVAQ